MIIKAEEATIYSLASKERKERLRSLCLFINVEDDEDYKMNESWVEDKILSASRKCDMYVKIKGALTSYGYDILSPAGYTLITATSGIVGQDEFCYICFNEDAVNAVIEMINSSSSYFSRYEIVRKYNGKVTVVDLANDKTWDTTEIRVAK